MSPVLTGGQRGDSPQFVTALERVRAPLLGLGRPRTRPDRVLVDKAHVSRANRDLRRHGIKGTVPIEADQAASRRIQGRHGPIQRHPALGTRPSRMASTTTGRLRYMQAVHGRM
jgi:hypothetical protein